MNVFRPFLTRAYPTLLALTIIVGLFSIEAIPYCIILLLVFWLAFEKDFSNFQLKLKLMCPSFFYCLVFAIGFFFAEDSDNALKTLEKQTSFLLFPILVICSKWDSDKYRWFVKTFSLAVVGVALVSIIMLLYFWFTRQEFVAQMDENYLQWKLPHLVGYHPTYMGMLIVSATILIANETTSFIERTKRYINLGAIIFLTAFLLYISPRMAVFLQFLVISHFIFYGAKSKILISKGKFIFILAGLFLAVFMVTKSNFLMNKLSRSLSENRFFLWSYALEEIKENHFIFGEGLGEGQIKLSQVLEQVNDPRTDYRGTDLHNQYLKNYMDLGIFGFAGTILLLLIPSIKLKKRALVLFMVSFGLAMFTESMLSLIKGIILFNVLSTVLISIAFKERNKCQRNH